MTSLPLSDALSAVQRTTPLVRCITNSVAMNSTANCLLAVGASPAMLHSTEEVAEFLLAWPGHFRSISVHLHHTGQKVCNLPPERPTQRNTLLVYQSEVAVGTTYYRQTLSQTLLAFKPSVIRGNTSRNRRALSGLTHAGRGVDATASTDEAREAAINLAKQQRCIVAMTGVQDFITDGTQHWRLSGGHAGLCRVSLRLAAR